ncbi:peroxin 14 putative (PEX14) [Leptomonas pyrrhocoris]|uniref:Peroxisomal membrane protein PEX14 n=1 Tax=Leptomonas pyrrhocoris TaxID=157538 RepID=A0A0M9FYB5_LEPPY|nr:peroxin 14 putative (PEX14) [Leptomonas pyrrhocoris]KPA78419.1 peroxin 14 putative (PEX14) [Leptomonas pyrrhocoris]|eukprot:XP_015656858.1 peroxin 14 putative (PEX14) [Leptomonas pyrrhocoris]
MSAAATITTAQAPPPQLPEPEQASPSQLDADPNVQSAIRFLQDPRARNAPVESQIRFLKGKSMSDAQIKHAFSKVGRMVTLEKIASVRAPAPMNAALGGQAATNNFQSGMSTQINSRPLSPVAPPTQPQYTQTLFPRSPPPPPEEPQVKGVDWRDVVIGTGAAILAGVAGYKLFNRYSPYEIRRKSDKKPPRAFRGPYAGRQRSIPNGSSESETDGSGFPPPHFQAPPLPPPPTTAPGALGQVAAAAAVGLAAEAEELKKLQTQLEETKEALTTERKKCADLAVSSAKIRAEKQQLSRANDRLTQQLDELKKDMEKLEEERAAAAGEGKLTATEEEPPRESSSSLVKAADETAEGQTPPVAVSPVVAADPLNATAVAPLAAAPETAAAPVVAPAAVTAAAATAVSTSPAAELPAAPSTSSPVPEPAVEVAPAPIAAEAALTAVPEPMAVPEAAPSNLAAMVPPAFLTPDPIKPGAAPAAPTH